MPQPHDDLQDLEELEEDEATAVDEPDASDGTEQRWTCPGFVDTWVKLPVLRVPAAARTPGG